MLSKWPTAEICCAATIRPLSGVLLSRQVIAVPSNVSLARGRLQVVKTTPSENVLGLGTLIDEREQYVGGLVSKLVVLHVGNVADDGAEMAD